MGKGKLAFKKVLLVPGDYLIPCPCFQCASIILSFPTGFLFSLLFHVTQHGHPSSDSTGPFCSNTTTLCWLFSLSAFKPPCPNSKQPSSCKEVAGEEALSGHRREAPLKRWCGQGCTPMPATRTYLSAGILTSTSNYESENLTSATLP